jgi:hypothetical protein
VFVATWMSGRWGTSPLNGRSERFLLSGKLPNLRSVRLFDSSIMDQYNLGISIPEELRRLEPVHVRGLVPMYFLLKQCDLQRQAFERDNGFLYDRVIRIRPDLLMKEDIPSEIMNDRSDMIFCSDYAVDTNFQASDKFAVGSSAAMTYYSSGIDDIQEALDSSDFSDAKSRPVGERYMFARLNSYIHEYHNFSIACEIDRPVFDTLKKRVRNVLR